MSKIKFHLAKFDKALHIQFICIDLSLLNKFYLCRSKYICLGAVTEWGNQFSIYKYGLNSGTGGRTSQPTLLISNPGNKDIMILTLESNEERDIYYNLILDTFTKSISENLWIEHHE